MAYDLIIRGGTVYDGNGGAPFVADIGVVGDEIATIGPLADATAEVVLEAAWLAVAPGFVNILSHSYFSILQDARSLSELTQGVTTQVFGEGFSLGPLNDEARQLLRAFLSDDVDMPWTRLSEYLADVEKRGTSQNVASFIGATSLRMCAVGSDDRPPTAAELDVMRGLVREEMADGALGIGSALIYPPGSYASTAELVELCRAAAPYGGMYISHLRSEANRFLEALDELLTIARLAEVPAEVYHLKAAGQANWSKMDDAIALVEAARQRGEPITADLYPYTAGATALFSAIPPAFHDGGLPRLQQRLRDPAARADMRAAILDAGTDWENLYLAAGGAEGVVLLSASKDEIRPHLGRTLADVAAAEGADDPVATLLDLVDRDPTIGAAYFIASEDNIRRQVALPWVSFGSDAQSVAPEEPFLDEVPHPRAYGTFARVLGRYVRDENVLTLPEAVRKLAALPAETLGLRGRGRLVTGGYADIVVFDPATVADRATYADPHQFSVGVRDVIVNGTLTLRDGIHTGAFAGRALAGRGRT